MINKKTAVVLILVIALLCALTALVFMVDTSDKTAQEPHASDAVTVFSADKDKLVSVMVATPDSEVKVVKADDGLILDDAENESVMPYLLDNLFSSVSDITAKSLVEETASNLAQYGLENPKYSITAKYEDFEKIFFAGDKTPAADGYYFKDADTSCVYVVHNSVFSALFKSKTDYYDISLLKVNADKLTGVSIKKDDLYLNLKLMDNPLVMGGYTLANWEMTEPYKLPLDTSQFSESVLENIKSLGASDIVSDKGDFSTFGLINPGAVLTLSDLDGVMQTLNISSPNGEKCYVSNENSQLIYVVDASDLAFLDVPVFNIASKFVNIPFVDDIDKIIVKSSDEEYTLSVSAKDKSYFFNETKIEEKRFKEELYQQVIGLVASGFSPEAKYSAPEVFIEYYLANGEYTKVEFVSCDDRNYAVFKNGTCIFKILKKDVNNMLKSLKEFK